MRNVGHVKMKTTGILVFVLSALIAGCVHDRAMTRDEHWRLALQAHKRKDYPTAINHYQLVLDDPRTPATNMHMVLYWKSEAELANGDAMAFYRTRKRLISDYPEGPYMKFVLGRPHYRYDDLQNMVAQPTNPPYLSPATGSEP